MMLTTVSHCNTVNGGDRYVMIINKESCPCYEAWHTTSSFGPCNIWWCNFIMLSASSHFQKMKSWYRKNISCYIKYWSIVFHFKNKNKFKHYKLRNYLPCKTNSYLTKLNHPICNFVMWDVDDCEIWAEIPSRKYIWKWRLQNVGHFV